jgi:hypothetical protein
MLTLTFTNKRGLENGFLGFDIRNRKAKIYGTGDELWTGTKVSTIGLAVSRLLKRPDEALVKNRYIYIYSVRTTQNEILSTLKKSTTTTGGRAHWDVQSVRMEDEIAEGRKLLENGDRRGVVPLILSYFYRPGMGADYTKDVQAANSILGLPTESVEDIVKSVMQ